MDDKQTWTVTFDTMGGSPIAPMQIIRGKMWNGHGQDPIKAEFEFNGWYTDKSLTKKYTFSFVKEDFTLYANWKGHNWTSLGTISNEASSEASFAVADNGDVYAAFQDGKDGKISVRKYSGTSWADMGTRKFSTGTARQTAIVLDKSGTPYIAYANEVGSTTTLVVQKWNGSSWESVGTNLDATACYSIKAVFSGDTLYVAGISSGLVVQKLTNTTWEKIGDSQSASNTHIYLAVDQDGTPHISYVDKTSQKPVVAKLVSNAWLPLKGMTAFGSGNNLILRFNGNTPYVAFYPMEGNKRKSITVKKYEADKWTSVGGDNITDKEMSTQTADIDFGINSKGEIFAFYTTTGSGSGYTVFTVYLKWDGSKWTDPQKIDNGLSILPLMVLKNDVPYVAYQAGGVGEPRVTVLKY